MVDITTGGGRLAALAQLGDPAVVAQLHRGHRDGLEFVDVVELLKAAPALRQQALDAGHVAGRQIGVGFDFHIPLGGAHGQGADAGCAIALLFMDLGDTVTQVQRATAGLDVLQDRPGQPAVGRSLEQVELGRLGARGEHHEDRQHAAGRDGLAVNEPQGVGDGVPHAADAFRTAAMADEPLAEADPIEGADGAHRPLVIHQTANDGAGAQGQGIAQLVHPGQLGGSEKGLQAVEGGTDREAEVQLAQIPALIDEQVGVVLGEQVFKGPHLAHQRKQVGVVEEEDMQPHLNVVAPFIHPAAHLAAHEGTGLIEINAVTGIHQIHRCRETGQSCPDDGNPHLQHPVTAPTLWIRVPRPRLPRVGKCLFVPASPWPLKP